MSDKEFLKWLYKRLIVIHRENPRTDYMLKFEKFIKEMEK